MGVLLRAKRTVTVYNGHLRGPMTLTPIAERIAVELSLTVFTTGLSRLGFELPTFRLRGKRSHPLRYRGGTWDHYRKRRIFI